MGLIAFFGGCGGRRGFMCRVEGFLRFRVWGLGFRWDLGCCARV